MVNNSILIVEDEDILRETLSYEVKTRGFNVAGAANGEEAIEIMDKESFDLVITDLVMEKLGGIDVLKKVNELCSETKVMILTGYGTIETAIEALRLGAADYMLKPYDKAELFLRVDNCLKQQELQRRVKIYENILPVCCKCKKIRDDDGKEHGDGEWMDLADYLTNKAKVEVSHGFCKECANEFNKEIDEMKKRE